MNKLLDFYEKQEFDLVQIQKYDVLKLKSNDKFSEYYDGKHPLEKDWINKPHKIKVEWISWLNQGYNIGIKTGKINNITVIDIDSKSIPLEIDNLIKDVVIQKTKNGFHLFFKYVEDLPKTNLRSKGLEIDIENDGGQVVVSPSIVEGEKRDFYIKHPYGNKLTPIIVFSGINIPEMPVELKEYLKSKVKPTNVIVSELEEVKDIVDLTPNDFDLNTIPEGTRNSLFMHLGGILRKELNLQQSTLVLKLLNQYLCRPSLSQSEFVNIIQSLDKYIVSDEIVLARDILEYLDIVNDATKAEIELAVKGDFQRGEAKKRVDRALKYLLKEQFVIRKGRNFIVLHKAEWKDTFIKEVQEVDFNVPYFNEVATIRNGDLIIIGAKSGTGKTHIAMNIIKQLVDQGKKPYYVSLECGSRFALIATALNLKEHQFFWDDHYSAEQIELEKGGITVVDWLLPKEYKDTDKLYEHFARQLKRKGGVLIVFTQLKTDGTFYAEEMVRFFASVVAKFRYQQAEGPEEGITSEFKTIKIREPKMRKQILTIPCEYNWESKELKMIKQEKQNETIV